MTFTVKDIQERYGVSQHTVLYWLSSGQLKCLNVGRDPSKKRARYRVTDAQLAEFEAMRQSTPLPPPTRGRRKQSNDVVKFY